MSIVPLSERWLISGLLMLAVFGSAVSARGQSAAPQERVSDAEIARILAERIDTHRQSIGIIVGLLEPDGRRIIGYGSTTKGVARPLDGDTVFEIGSITKVFTALLLADAVERGEVALTDPVARFLPTAVRVPERGRAITLGDLASHMSGLPRLPSNMTPKDQNNPYADYTVEQLYAFLSSHQLARDVGAQYEYSNLGGGLLGHVLALRAGMSYEALVEMRITRPLGMASTRITLSDAMRARLASGYTSTLQPAANWDLPTLAGAGALRSTVNDLLLFASAAVGARSTPLDKAFARMLATRHPTPAPGLQIALGWHVFTTNDHDVVWHDGGTGGYRTFLGFDPVARTAVVALSNAGTLAGVNDIGRHMLDRRVPLLAADSPLLTPPKERAVITVAPEVLDAYVGRYQLAPAAFFTITRKGSALLAELTGQFATEIFPETQRDFFYKLVDAQITFETDAAGKATALVLHQMGRDQRALRIEGEPVMPKEIALAPELLEGYVGRYRLTPQVEIVVTRQETRLFAQLTGQSALEVYASGPRDFFYKVVNAQLTFEAGADGKATAVVLHQLGQKMSAPRVP
jgi:D-alanyl-D-alanine-carboxypeptidase/D-alanyl-D-alanine-endopeptidase